MRDEKEAMYMYVVEQNPSGVVIESHSHAVLLTNACRKFLDEFMPCTETVWLR